MEVQQGVHLRIHDKHNAAATATVAAIRTAERLEFLAVHRRAAVAAVACTGMDDDAVDKPWHRTSSPSNVKLLR